MRRSPSLEAALTIRPRPREDDFCAANDPSQLGAERRRGILVRVNPATWRELHLLRIDRGQSVQSLMIEAINALLVRDGRPPVA